MRESWTIDLDSLRLGYGDHVVLEDITATLPAGRISVILGGSGCGKSTLLRHIIGLKKPLAGQIRLGGKDIFALSAPEFRRLRRRMGVLFQDGALLGSLSLGENVALPLREHTSLGEADIRDLVVQKLSLVGLEDFVDFYPNELSGGMRKRAGLARAMVTDPPVLLCDEPTSGLDPINAAQMDELLLAMKQQYPDMTIVVVSHDLESLRRIADHVLVLHARHVAFSGPLEELLASRETYLRQFLDRQADPVAGRGGVSVPSERVRAALDAWLNT